MISPSVWTEGTLGPGVRSRSRARLNGVMKYLIMIHSNPKSRARWETLSEQERSEFGYGHAALTKSLKAAGILRAAEGLPDPSAAKRVSVRDGETIASDGPLAEAQECPTRL